jgi:hypothetical protein
LNSGKRSIEAYHVGGSSLLGNPHAGRFLGDRGVDTGLLRCRTADVTGFRQFVLVVLLLAVHNTSSDLRGRSGRRDSDDKGSVLGTAVRGLRASML